MMTCRGGIEFMGKSRTLRQVVSKSNDDHDGASEMDSRDFTGSLPMVVVVRTGVTIYGLRRPSETTRFGLYKHGNSMGVAHIYI